MQAYGRALDLRHLAWGLANKGLVESLADSIDKCNVALTADLVNGIHDFPHWIPEPEIVCAGELATFRRQCEERGGNPDKMLAVLNILTATMQGEANGHQD